MLSFSQAIRNSFVRATRALGRRPGELERYAMKRLILLVVALIIPSCADRAPTGLTTDYELSRTDVETGVGSPPGRGEIVSIVGTDSMGPFRSGLTNT